MTIKEMLERKKELGYSYEKISQLSGVPVGTVQKVLGGITKSPRYDTLLALERVLGDYVPSTICEPPAVYHVEKRQGEYTIEDYYALPDEQRVELIDGVFYDMAAPSVIHQILAGEICHKFREYVMEKKGTCIPVVAPLDVQLDCDEKTMLQPDVMIICNRDKLSAKKGRSVYGAPELVVEILSKSTRRKDMTKKLQKYADAGVREYWLVDPDKKKIITYFFEEDERIDLYSFEDKVPVRMFGGNCVVDFKEIYEYVKFLYEADEETP